MINENERRKEGKWTGKEMKSIIIKKNNFLDVLQLKNLGMAYYFITIYNYWFIYSMICICIDYKCLFLLHFISLLLLLILISLNLVLCVNDFVGMYRNLKIYRRHQHPEFRLFPYYQYPLFGSGLWYLVLDWTKISRTSWHSKIIFDMRMCRKIINSWMVYFFCVFFFCCLFFIFASL